MSSSNRTYAINLIASRPVPGPAPAVKTDISFYGEDVFNAAAIRQYLPKECARKLLSTITEGAPLDPAIADDVAHAMKEWAMARGVTHFTHWFQPLTGGTAEKHDAFLEGTGMAEAIMTFSGKNLIMSEPDASSFPSGGLRCTFEARGYTAWDPTSPAFIKRHAQGATLCIPTAFCSYTGAALDRKTPLLRSIQALRTAVKRFMKCFGKENCNVQISLGAEQEYFLIDRNFYFQRPDLVQTGRTLFGAPPPKHQQLEDHYFGAIRPRVLNFMSEVERELWKLGIPARTRHNEVAPAQFELAPMYEEQNLAVDHNMLVMEILRQSAERNGLVCLLHEKPFAGVNGSGKHNNWSISCDGRQLLDPGSNPAENALFLTALCAIIRGIDLHSDLLRTTTGAAGNDHRLGANEAPPAITSIFLGEQLTGILEELESGAPAGKSGKPGRMKIGVDTLPTLPRDATDRNRTSPFAFTGNKFEFRAPGSSQSCSGVNMMLNTIMAESLDFFSDHLERFTEKNFNGKLQKLLKEVYSAHKRVIFNGDNYSAAWAQEAERRGLVNLNNTLDALKPLKYEANKKLMADYGVLSEEEMDSRYEVFLEEYHRKIRIEGEVGLEMARSTILPAVSIELGSAVGTLNALGDRPGKSAMERTVTALGTGLDQLSDNCIALEKALKKDDSAAIIAALEKVRCAADTLESVLDDKAWPLPKYREILFVY
ncbi:MAG: glutamine synthetase type III [Lentisphaerae bacterium]|nr:glutamine synthetase type III [Lentisphaerota bacterium]